MGMSAAHIADLSRFVTASPSSFHAAAEVARRLGVAGFTQQAEDAPFAIEPGGGYVLRDGAIVGEVAGGDTGTVIDAFREVEAGGGSLQRALA